MYTDIYFYYQQSACGAKIQICRTLMNRPEIVSVGVVWDSERPSLDHIMDVFATVGTTLHLSDVFHSVVDNRWAATTTHNLVGVVTYYGKHYSTFFFHTKLRVWIYFDDATVREVGPRWEQVVEKCRRGRYQPLLLLYAVPGGTPVNTDNAPKMVTPFQTEKTFNKKPPAGQSLIRRSVTPSPEKPNVGPTRRAITPNPDCTLFQQRQSSLPRSYNEYQNLSVIQDNLYGGGAPCTPVDTVDGDIGPEANYISRRAVETVLNAQNTKLHPIQRTLSNGSSTSNPSDGISIPDHQNIPRRRDSGNWSGDRNSASSSSSTTMDHPYLYLVGKMHNRPGSVPGSPTRTKAGDSSSGSSVMYDAGYDSYSLSSNDSFPMQQGLKHNLSLAKIPENHQSSNLHYRPPHSPLSPTSPTCLNGDDCEKLCREADQLLDKSRQAEDLDTALVLCNAAASKARAAMDAPYNNPNAMVFARMKHNTCVMRARGLHRRIQQEKEEKEGVPIEIRHTREGSSGSGGRHSRQSSRDKTQHSRQNSKELLTVSNVVEKVSPKTIEIYATLPKKKGVLKSKSSPINIEEDSEYMLYDKSPGRESRSLFSRSKSKDEDKLLKEKRSRSEDRNKITRDFSIAPTEALANAKDTLKREKYKEEKDDKKENKEAKAGKKQHKVRRKLLMGGLIRRKNRSMPDLTEGKGEESSTQLPEKTMSSVDDSSVGLKGSEKMSTMCGYLSEGHLEFTGNGNNANPNLERSRLMRKSFHGSAGKVLTVAKVPPPPPLRTTSQLSASKLTNGEVCQPTDRPPYPLPVEATNPSYYHHHHHPPIHQIYSNHANIIHNNHKNIINNRDYSVEPQSLPFLPSYKDKMPNCQPRENNQTSYEVNKRKFSAPERLYNEHTVVTQADVHQEQSPLKDASYNEQYQLQVDSGVDEVDCVMPNSREPVLEELPPYPSPLTSAIHSRQASEDFPPPPSALDLSALDEQLKILRQTPSPKPSSSSSSLLSELQKKREQILSQEKENKEQRPESVRSSGDTWLRELQAKQAALKMKKNQETEPRTQNSINTDVNKMINHLTHFAQDPIKPKQIHEISRDIPPTEAKVKSVKDLASRFEKVNVPSKSDISKPLQCSTNSYSDISPINNSTVIESQQNSQTTDQLSISGARENSIETGVLSLNRRNSLHENHGIDQSQIEEEIKEVEMISAAVKQGIHPDELEKKNKRNRNGKKKSVSFCDQVILVATAEDQEDDSYIPNPILERVLRSALNKPETAAIQQEIRSLREAELKKEAAEHTQQRNKSPIMIEESNSTQNIQAVSPQLSAVTPNVQQYYNNPPGVYNYEQKEYATQNNVSNPQIQREYSTQAPVTNMQNGMMHENDLRQSPLNQHHTQPQSYYPSNQNHNSSNIPLPECSPTSSTNNYPMHLYNGSQQTNPPLRQTLPQYVLPPQHSNLPHQYLHQNSYPPNSPVSPQPDQYKHESYQTHQMNQYNINQNYNHINQPIRQSPVQSQSQQYAPYYHANHMQPSHQQQTVPPQSNYNHVPQHSVQTYNQHAPSHHSPSPLTISQQHSQYVTKMQPQRSPMSPTGMAHQPNYYPQQTNSINPAHQSPYQRVPLPADFQNTNHQRFTQNNGEVSNQPYQRVPPTLTNGGNHVIPQQEIAPYQHVPTKMNGDMNNLPYQRVPPTPIANGQNAMQQEISPYQQVPTKYSPPYQYALPPKQLLQQKKSVHFEPGTKGGNESPTPKAIVSPIIVNNTQVNNSLNNKIKCNLCRKKIVASPELYCNDCEFYMSRFKPRTQ